MMQVDDELIEVATADLTPEQIDRANVYDLREIANYIKPMVGVGLLLRRKLPHCRKTRKQLVR